MVGAHTQLIPSEIVERFWQAWAARDVTTVFSLLAPDVRYSLNMPQHVLPFGGEVVGKSAVSDRLRTILDIFDTVSYQGRITRTDGDWVHGWVTLSYQHKVCREVFEGNLRIEVRIQDGLIAELLEHTDVERATAFMRLVSWRASSG